MSTIHTDSKCDFYEFQVTVIWLLSWYLQESFRCKSECAAWVLYYYFATHSRNNTEGTLQDIMAVVSLFSRWTDISLCSDLDKNTDLANLPTAISNSHHLHLVRYQY